MAVVSSDMLSVVGKSTLAGEKSGRLEEELARAELESVRGLVHKCGGGRGRMTKARGGREP